MILSSYAVINFLPENFLPGIILAILISLSAYYLKMLSKSGAVAVFILALIVFGFGGWKWTIPILTFFIFSSLLSKLPKKNKQIVQEYFAKTSRRDFWQVTANGIIAGILVTLNYFNPSEIYYYIYVSAVASVCADTWGTEVGTLFNTRTYNILSLKRVEQGESGAVSFVGLIGSVSGALLIALSALFWIDMNHLSFLVLIVIAGTAGSLIDSLLGATIQLQYKCYICGRVTDKNFHCNEPSEHFRGLNWMNNDLVNLSSSVAGGLVGYFLIDSFR